MNASPSNKSDRIQQGVCAYEENRLDIAEKIFVDLSKDFKKDFEIDYHLGLIYQKKNLIQQSLHHFLKAYSYNPKAPLPLISLAKIYISLGNYREALNFSNQVLEIDEDYSEGILLKGTALLALKDINDATIYLKKWLLKHPKKKKVLLHLCMISYQKHNIEEACSICKIILSVIPNDVETTFCYCIIQLKPIYDSYEEIQSIRLSYQKTLERLAYLVEHEPKENFIDAVEIIGYLQSFPLTYQGENDKSLQALYGKVVTQILSSKYPKFIKHNLSTSKIKGPIRVGFVSKYFKSHSNWKTRLKGWIKEINKNDFHVYCYCPTNIKTNEIQEILPIVSKFTMGLNTLEDYANAILDDELDIIIYQEIGMDQLTMQLASFKLAPIQCTSWGHPETSGFPSVDYFLSSELMEPQNADEYYTEKLVKLPNLSIYYEPTHIELLKKSRKDFSLPCDAILYWCCQNYSKFLPQFDHVFVEIKKAVPFAKFVFINQSHTANQAFYTRMKKNFEYEDLNIDDCCIFLPQLTIQEFATVTSLMDVFLDSIGWSGCNTTLESINYNLPIVTFPLESMRSRHTVAILTMMGLKDEVAVSLNDYIKKASILGLSKVAREKFKEKIAKNKSKLYQDNEAIIGLEDFLKSLF